MFCAITGILASRSRNSDSFGILTDSLVLASCQEIISLNANVIGDVANRTYLWEQIFGPAVEWLEPQNQLSVLYRRIGSGDTGFRFWVDKGQPSQRFRDTIVSSAARETFENEVFKLPLGKISLVGSPSSLQFAPSFSADEVSFNSQNRILTFVPGDVQHPSVLEAYYIFKHTPGNKELIQILPPHHNYFVGALSNTVYSVASYYRTYQNFFLAESGTASYQDLNDTFVLNDQIGNPIGALNGSISLFQRISAEIQNTETPADVANGMFAVGSLQGNMSLIQRISAELLTTESPEENALGIGSYGVFANTPYGSVNIHQVINSPGLITL